MKFIENFKASREAKERAVLRIDREIDDRWRSHMPDGSENENYISADEMSKLMDMRRKIVLNGIDAGDILKVVANVAVVAVIVGFEVRNIMSQKGSRFIKVL